MPWEVGIRNEGVVGGGDDSVWMRLKMDFKNGFSTGWLGDTEEEFKEVLKCWGYCTWDWFTC